MNIFSNKDNVCNIYPDKFYFLFYYFLFYSHPSIYRASRGKRKMHGISRGTVYRGTHFLGPNFNQNRLIFIFLMPTVNRVVLGLCKRYVCNLINFPIPCLNLSWIIRLLTFSVLLRSTICLLPGPW